MEYEIYKSDELYHWGVKGMRWGIRRYQNKDGSLTPAGQKRISKQENAKAAAVYYKNQRNETDNYYYQKLNEHGKLGEKKWQDAVKNGYKGDLAEWFETEMWKDQEMVDLQNQLDSIAYKHRNLDRKYEASLAYAETLVFKNSDRTVDKITSEGIWKEGKEAVDGYLDAINRDIPVFKQDPNNRPDGDEYNDMYHSAISPDNLSEDALAHWGVKGMRWGVRRYQNKDGSLTPAGQKRKAKLEAKLEKLSGKPAAKAPTEPAKKSVKDMTDDELFKAVNRSRLETEYARLNPKKESTLKKLGDKILNELVVPSAINAGKSYVDSLVKKYTSSPEPTVDDLLKKYGDLSDTERERYQKAAAVKTWENTLLGKKNK